MYRLILLTVLLSLPASSQFHLFPPDFVYCAYAVTPGSQNVPAAGGSFTAQVATACPFYATPSDPWIKVTGPDSFSGAASVSWSVEPSTAALPRTGQLYLGLSVLNITQAGIGCVVSFALPRAAIPP